MRAGTHLPYIMRLCEEVQVWLKVILVYGPLGAVLVGLLKWVTANCPPGFCSNWSLQQGFCRDLRSAWPSQQVVCDNCKVSIPCWNPVSVPFPSILSKLRVKSCSWGVLIRDMRTCRVWAGFWVPGSIMGWAWYYLVWITALCLSSSESIIITAFGVNEVWKGLLQSDFAPPKGGQTDHL